MERFLVDRHLRKLGKWLRILGYDTRCERGELNDERLREAAREGRIVLTRRRYSGPLPTEGGPMVLEGERVEAQLDEVCLKLGLHPEPASRLTRCIRCNRLLEASDGKRLAGLVPVYVLERHERFSRCAACGRIYWPGTHCQRIEAAIRRRIPDRRP